MADPILVTGATGYLGSALVETLVGAGEHVRILSNPNDRIQPVGALWSGVDEVSGDVTDAHSVDSAVRDATRIYHLAGIASPNSRLGDAIWRTNVLGSYNVAAAAVRHGVHRVVHVSSTAAVGYPSEGVVADEDFDPRESVIDNVYAATKRASERVMLDIAERGVEVVVVNPSAVFAPGSGNSPRSWQGLLLAAHRGLLRVIPPGGTAVCSARDFVAGTTAAMRMGQSGRRYILSTANLTYRRIAELLVDSVGRSHRVRSVPISAIRAVSGVNRAFRDLTGRVNADDALVPENVELMARRLYYAPDRAVRELGIPSLSIPQLIAEFAR